LLKQDMIMHAFSKHTFDLGLVRQVWECMLNTVQLTISHVFLLFTSTQLTCPLTSTTDETPELIKPLLGLKLAITPDRFEPIVAQVHLSSSFVCCPPSELQL